MIHDVQRPTGLSYRRDGRAIAFALEPAFREIDQSPQSRIWRAGSDAGAVQLTFGPGADRVPCWSPAEDCMAFLSDRAQSGKFDVYVLRDGLIEGPLVSFAGSVEKMVWSTDGATLVCLVADEGLDTASSEGAVPLCWSAQADPGVWAAKPRRRLFAVEVFGGEPIEIGSSDLSVWDFDLLPDGGFVAIASPDAAERGWHTAALVRIDRREGQSAVLLRSPEQLQCPTVDPSGARVAVLEGPASDRNLVSGRIRLIDLETGRIRTLGAGVLDDVTHVAWVGVERLGFAGWAGFGTRSGQVRIDGELEHVEDTAALLGSNRFAAAVRHAPHGTGEAAVIDRPHALPEVFWRNGPTAAWMALTDFNRAVQAGHPARQSREVAWTSTDGTAIDGLLIEPEGLQGRGPLVVVVHGGPTTSAKHVFDPCDALMHVAAGFRVLLPNYRGSVGRGREFAGAVRGDPAGADYQDIVSGVDWCVAQGFADAGRVGITGVSYGGYLSAWAAATDRRFAAAVVISGIADLFGCHHNCNHAFSEWIAGAPVSDPLARRLLTDRSPVAVMTEPRTPTLILHGELDQCTPVSQGEALYRALQRHDVATRLVIFPREGHAITERAHRTRLRSEAVGWFETYLHGPA